MANFESAIFDFESNGKQYTVEFDREAQNR